MKSAAAIIIPREYERGVEWGIEIFDARIVNGKSWSRSITRLALTSGFLDWPPNEEEGRHMMNGNKSVEVMYDKTYFVYPYFSKFVNAIMLCVHYYIPLTPNITTSKKCEHWEFLARN